MKAEMIRMQDVIEGSEKLSIACALWEIAAQLADLNEQLGNESRPVCVRLCSSNDDIPVLVRSMP